MLFFSQCASDLDELPEREFMFAKPRRWRFDFAWPERSLAVEIEGGIWVNGAHTRGKHFESDCRKYNEATSRGWRVFRFTAEMVNKGEAVAIIKAILGRRVLGKGA